MRSSRTDPTIERHPSSRPVLTARPSTCWATIIRQAQDKPGWDQRHRQQQPRAAQQAALQALPPALHYGVLRKGETRFSDGATPTTWRFTGQREDATIGLYFYNARYLDPQLGRFTLPDTIVPEPGNPQALNRYSYVSNNPLRFVDDSGEIAIDIVGGGGGGGGAGMAVVMLISGLAQTMSQQASALTVRLAPAANATGQTWSLAGNQIMAAGDQLSQAAQSAGQAGNTAGPGGLDPNDPWFRNARTSPHVTQSVLDKIRPEYFSPNARFGRAFYVAQRGETAVAEVEAHGSKASQVIRYQVDLNQAKVLDLTNSTIAKAWGYINNPTAYSSHQALAQRAMQQGYNVIKYASYRGPGSNLALLA